MEDSPTPKRARTTCRPRKDEDSGTCIICAKSSSVTELSKPNSDSIETLLRAAEIRKFQPIQSLKVHEGGLDFYYHRQCRAAFTHKKSLEALQKHLNESPTSSTETRTSMRRPCTTSTSRVYEETCIFCEKKNKYCKASKSREPLSQCREIRSDARVRDAAVKKMDTRLLAITSRELVAAEAHYHKSCYRDYTREDKLLFEKPADADSAYNDAEKRSYEQLFAYIRSDLFQAPRVDKITNLSDRLSKFMEDAGYNAKGIKPQTKKHLRRKLEREFQESLHIFSDDKGKLLIMPDNLSIVALAKENIALKEQMRSLTQGEDINVVTKKCALNIRTDIKKLKPNTSWPPQPDELNEEYIPAPPSLTKFLTILLTGDMQDTQNLSQSKAQRHVHSISQDCLFVVSGGRLKPPKHVMLPWAIKSLTGNVELIKMMNRLGHGISYSTLEEMDTSLCLEKQAIQADLGIVLPTNSYPRVPTNLAFDNIDRIEETLSGECTSHRVNGIIIQPEVSTCRNQVTTLKTTDKSAKKKRSITPLPVDIPEYNAGERTGPPVSSAQQINYSSCETNAEKKNLVWVLARQLQTDEQLIPSWTGFNILIRDNITVKRDTVGYLPTINAPATQMSTVHEILQQVLKIMEALELKDIVCVFDQALYSKAAEITWKNQAMLNKVVLRMGVFHTVCNLLSIIGKRFGSAGLRDLAVESSIIAEGSIDSILEGRKYNRGVRLCKLIYEALMRLAWKAFTSWIKNNHQRALEDLEITIEAICSLHKNTCGVSLKNVLQQQSFEKIFALYKQFLMHWKTNCGQMAAFWVSFIDIAEILLDLVRASREGDWLLHLSAIQRQIPWCFAYDKQNYARYLPVYYNEMTQLPESHPEVHAHFMNGGFSVQLGGENPFGKIPIDQTIEETANRDTQTPGGTKGFSLKPRAVSRYYITAEYRSGFLKQLRNMIDLKHCGTGHTDLEKSRIMKDEQAIQNLLDLMENNWINPFGSEPLELTSLSTGTVAPPHIASDLLTAKEKGELAYKSYKENRLQTHQQAFNDRLPKLQLKTFSNLDKKRVRKSSNKEIVLKADHKLFGHMVLIATSRKLNMREVLEHPLGPLPWSLANSDGTLKKTNKAALARKLEENVASAEHIPQPSAHIIDGMSLVHKMNGENLTFEEFSLQLLNRVLQIAGNSKRVDIVFDVYTELSIKTSEWTLRGSDRGLRFTNIMPGHKIQQWRRLLSCGESKLKLIQFIVENWQHHEQKQRFSDKILFVTCKRKCSKISQVGVSEVGELETSQEEADGRLLLHAKHASADFESIVIHAEDTDVLLLCLAHNRNINSNLFIKCGTKTRVRYIDVNKVAAAVGQSICDALLGMHAFTGCDTVSSFGGRGKLSPLKLLRNQKYQDAFAQLGTQWNLTDELINSLEEFTCRLYAAQSNITDVNELRYSLFRAKKGNVESGQLPPCKDCLYLHAARANYQSAIWHRSLEQNPQTPSPLDCKGWILDDEGQLQVNWMTGLPAPDTVLEFMSCNCLRKCQLPDCQCMLNGLKCTDTCRLQSCDNMRIYTIGDLDDDSDDESDEEIEN